MSSQTRLTRAFEQAKEITFNKNDKFILFSDCHRGDNSFADDFSRNRNIYFHALNHYYNEGYQYIELGDGDELWENRNFKTIFKAHRNVFKLMRQFHNENRLHLIYGNHDMVYRNPAYVKKHLSTYFDERFGEEKILFSNLTYHEGIILKEQESGKKIFLTHGHQADFMNYVFWKFNRFMVRALWKPLQVMGISDPTSPAKNFKELIKVERRMKDWITANNNQMTIIGHTHRPRFPQPDEVPFFNDGSAVHPRSITGIEIADNTLSLIKWHINSTEEGFLKINRTVLEGPTKLSDYK
jgi:predicted phosphodiesterase